MAQATSCRKLPNTAPKSALVEAHKNKMLWKRDERARRYAGNGGKGLPRFIRKDDGSMVRVFSANINRHTGKPHLHTRAIARRLAQGSVA